MPTQKGRVFVGLALSSTMVKGDAVITRQLLTIEQVTEILSRYEDKVVSCCNPSHEATLAAIQMRFGINIRVPSTAPKISLDYGDSLVVLSAKFGRRLSGGGHYTQEDIDRAEFEFVLYHVLNPRCFLLDPIDMLEVNGMGTVGFVRT